MPGDPKQCREHAKRCWALASEITNPVLKESLTDAAQRWALLATELEMKAADFESLLELDRRTSSSIVITANDRWVSNFDQFFVGLPITL